MLRLRVARALAGPAFGYVPMFPTGADTAEYDAIPELAKGLSVDSFRGEEVLRVEPWVLTAATKRAFSDIAHYLRSSHLAQVRSILDDPEASANDRFVALELLRNAVVAARGVLPGCQDTGTAIIAAKRGRCVWTEGEDEAAMAKGVFECYTERNLRYSQMVPTKGIYAEVNSGSNLPAQIDLFATSDAAHAREYSLFCMAKGGGSANKSFLFQETKATLSPATFPAWLEGKIRHIGTSACPPYHLAIVVGGTSAEAALKAAKMASAREYDTLPTVGEKPGHAIRDPEFEAEVVEMCRKRISFGAQFGGKYFVHDVRVVRLPRHGASCPIAIAVSCAADRQVKVKLTPKGAFIERLERNPARFLPPDVAAQMAAAPAAAAARAAPRPGDTAPAVKEDVVRVDLRQPMAAIQAQLSKYPIRTRLSLTGPMIVARDMAHARIRDSLNAGGAMPAYLKDHIVYYAGPAKTPAGKASGSFGPTTAGRMDSFADLFMSKGGSLVSLAKGNRSKAVTDACKAHGGFYLGSIGGPAAVLAEECIRKVEVVDFAEMGMEAVWRIEVENFPAFIVVDDKGNDFFAGM